MLVSKKKKDNFQFSQCTSHLFLENLRNLLSWKLKKKKKKELKIKCIENIKSKIIFSNHFSHFVKYNSKSFPSLSPPPLLSLLPWKKKSCYNNKRSIGNPLKAQSLILSFFPIIINYDQYAWTSPYWQI